MPNGLCGNYCERSTPSLIERSKDARCDVVMLQQIAEDVAQEAVRAAGIEGLVEASARSVDAKLPAEVSTVGSRV